MRVINRLVPFYQSREALKFLVRGLKDRALLGAAVRFLGVRKPQEFIASKAGLALLASESEKQWCEVDYQIHFARQEVFPNGLEDASAFAGDGSERDIDVIMTGRIESRKNQVSVLKALSGSGLKVYLLGALNESHRQYLAELKTLLAKNPTFELLGPRPHAETLSWLTRAKVYISASWLEVMSLADFEAFAAGCRVIASCHGSTREVFGDLMRYVKPGSVEEIRAAIFTELASKTPVEIEQRRRLLEKYLWSNLGNELIQIYQREIKCPT